ncbi:ABC transporter ATP-binding protein [Candidatus Parcubacteria bacterium]|nr:ABC transporter ATP-binding protein [Candidatus Parcubacteria bacterium]
MISVKNLRKAYKDGDIETSVLKGIDFEVKSGAFIAIMGRSGAGKSTFLYQISLLDDPTSGEIVIDGHHTHAMSADEKMRFRLSMFGYVFQDYALMPELTALENTALPLLMQGDEPASAYEKAERALARVNLSHRLKNLPSQLSGGEQQRISVARAVVHHPKILFADEPTGSLDSASALAVMHLLTELHREGQTIIMVTHEEEYAKMAERIIHLEDGKIKSETASL